MYRLILENYIKSYLFEAFDENLRIKVSEALNEIVKNYSSEDREYDIFYDLVSVVDKFNMKHLGSGNSRKAYAIPGQDWVLKIAVGRSDKDEFERKMNAIEVEIGIGDHGPGPQNLFVKLYDWDKLSVQPSWLIVQRVVPLYRAHKNMSIEDQALEVRKVKRSESGMILDPITLTLSATVGDAFTMMHENKI